MEPASQDLPWVVQHHNGIPQIQVDTWWPRLDPRQIPYDPSEGEQCHLSGVEGQGGDVHAVGVVDHVVGGTH